LGVIIPEPVIIGTPLRAVKYQWQREKPIFIFGLRSRIIFEYFIPKILYSLIKNASSYSQIVSSSVGCTWTIEFEDGTNSTITIPSDYAGSKECYFTFDNLAYNNNDAIDNAIFNLFSDLDLDSDRRIETKFSENDLSVNSIEITGIPFTWETEVQVRIWR